MILGWFFDFRRLLVSLPDNKFKAWSDAIREMIQTKITTSSILECNIGRLVHLSMVLPGVHHFMSRLRDLLTRSKNRSKIKINQVCLEDLELMLFFLEKAHKGISLNQIVYRRPTHVYRSDSCPSGLGGYSHEGWAWRFYIPYELQGRATNNLLEHIASIITVWIDILAGRLKPGDCSLSMTDSTTSEGWAHKTNFSKDNEEPIQATIRIQVAREHAMRLLENDIKEFSPLECNPTQAVSGSMQHVISYALHPAPRTLWDITVASPTTYYNQLPQQPLCTIPQFVIQATT